VWVVVVEGRAFVRSWKDKPTGWSRAFLAEPLGTLHLAGREMPVRAARDCGPQFGDGAERPRVYPPQTRDVGPEDGKYGIGVGCGFTARSTATGRTAPTSGVGRWRRGL
jgi:hypothetical protein